MAKPAALSRGWIALTGITLMALPVSAVGTQSARLATGEALKLNVSVIQQSNDSLVPTIRVSSPIHTLSTLALSGDNSFKVGDTAYIFLKYSGKNWYPYAILRSAPVISQVPNDSVMLLAKVKSKTMDTLSMEYGFDRVSPPQSFMQALMDSPNNKTSIGLALSADGRSSVSALYHGDIKFDQRVILKSVLFGRKNISASKPPPT